MEFNVSKLREDLAKSDEFKKGEAWQAVVSLCYDEWQKPENNKDWDYNTLLGYAHLTYGLFAKLLVLMGSYNGEVCNGGHDQYFANGYASNGGSCFDRHDTGCRLTREMLKLMDGFKLDTFGEGAEIYKIIKDFCREIKNNNPYDQEDDRDDDSEPSELSKLDDRLYEINDAWEKTINKLIIDWLEKGSNPISEPTPVVA